MDDLESIVLERNNQSIEQVLASYLSEKQQTLAFAESCTGGYLSHLITHLPGSSTYFKGSVVAYANEIKNRILQVPEDVLEGAGAVSEATVKHMAQNTRDLFQTDYAIAVSGIAGPGGGTPEKPVGTVWIGLASDKSIETKCFHFGAMDRELIIRKTALHALLLLIQLINNTSNK
jgi:nicotinamide-nucleotide amidase